MKKIFYGILLVLALPVAALAQSVGGGAGGDGSGGFGIRGGDDHYTPSSPVRYYDNETGLSLTLDLAEGVGIQSPREYYFRMGVGVWLKADLEPRGRSIDKVYVYFGNSYGAFVSLGEWVYCPYGDSSRYNPTAIVSFLRSPTVYLTVEANEASPAELPPAEPFPSYLPEMTGDPAIDVVLTTLAIDNSTLAKRKYCLCGLTDCAESWLGKPPPSNLQCGTPPNCFFDLCG